MLFAVSSVSWDAPGGGKETAMGRQDQNDFAEAPDKRAAQDRALPPMRLVERAGGWMAAAAFVLAAIWVSAAFTVAVAVLGASRIAELTTIETAALFFVALLPAALLVFSGAAAREGVRAQAQARRLADAADRMMNPSPVAEAAARRLGISVRGEIAALDRSLGETLAKLEAVESVIARQTQAVDQAALTAQQGAGHLVNGLERERAVLTKISEDLGAQAARVSDAIGRQTNAITASAREADAQLRAADQVLEERVQSFGAASAMMGDRTALLTQAAAQTANSTQRLESALAGALDTLAKATSLTEAAKQSTEAATLAANATAGAVRETTTRAIDDAKRVAELIRAEAQAVEREAAAALERLREAADMARTAAEGARAATGALPPRQPAPTPAPAPSSRPFFFNSNGAKDRETVRRDTDRRAFDRMESERLGQVARAPDSDPRRNGDDGAAAVRVSERPQSRLSLDETVAAERSNRERWTWRDMVGAIDAEAQSEAKADVVVEAKAETTATHALVYAAPNEFEARPVFAMRPAPEAKRAAPTVVAPLASAPALSRPPQQHPATASMAAAFAPRGAQSQPPLPPSSRSTDIFAVAGLQLQEVFSVGALDRIAGRARNGTQARRRAVRDAAPDAVRRLSDLLEANPGARQQAARFLEAEGARLADLLGRGRASMTADATRAFLLLDAASS
jgi:hypothetical protein